LGGSGLGTAAKIFGGTQGLALAPNLVIGIGAVGRSLGQLAGLMGVLPAAAGAAGLAMGTLKIATSGFGAALKSMDDPQKFADAVAKLAPSAQDAARSIQALTPQLTQFKMSVQGAAFAGLGQQITDLSRVYLPMFQNTMTQIAASANKSLRGVGDMLKTPALQADLGTMTTNMSRAFDTLSGALQPLVKAFDDIGTVGSAFLPGIASSLQKAAQSFADFISAARDSGKLGAWMQSGIDSFTHLKNTVENLGTALAGVFHAADGGGRDFLTTVDQLSQKLTTWVNSTTGQAQLKNFFGEARAELEKWTPVLQDLPGIAANAFQGAKAATDQWFPIIRDLTGFLRENPGLVREFATAFTTWKAIDGLLSVKNTLGLIDTLLRVTLPADAAAAASGISGALSTIAIPAALSAFLAWNTARPDQSQAAGSSRFAGGPGGTNPNQVYRDIHGNIIGPGALPTPGPGQDVSPTRSQNRTSRPPTPGQSAGSGAGSGLNPASPGWIAAPPIQSYQPPTPTSPGGSGAPSPSTPGDTGDHTVAPSGFDWNAVMAHEGGTWSNADTGHNGHYGGLQFSPETWAAYGGLEFASRADYASPEEQMTVADRTAFYGYKGLAPQGLQAWEAITKGTVPGISTSTAPPRPSPQYGAAITPSLASSSSSTSLPQAPGGFPQGANANYTPAMMRSLNIPALYTNPAGGGAPAIPQWVQTFVRQHGGPSLVAASTPHTGPSGSPGLHGDPGTEGWAIDVVGDPAEMDKLAQYLLDNPSASAQLIHQSTITGKQYGVAGGAVVSTSPNNYYNQPGGDYQSESSMVHWAPSGAPTGVPSSNVYTGPGQSAQNPMYVRSSDTSGQQLGQDIVSGIAEIFGLGDLVKDPTQFGLFKIFKGIMGLRPSGGDTSGAPDTGAGNGSGGGDPLLDFVGQFIPGMNGSSTGGLANALPNLLPGQPGQQQGQQQPTVVDNSVNLQGSNFGYSPNGVKDQVTQAQTEASRPGLRSLPSS
jgi:Transglycosylase-like domain